MSDLETRVATHYDTGAMLDRIRAALETAGVDPSAVKPSDLKGVDEFHTGGIEATAALLTPLGLTPATTVLDIGCGIGGTARFIAEAYGCKVTGIDLTPAFVEVGMALTDMVGLSGKVTLVTGSALDLPFADASFDLVTMMHVGMNIEDKPRLFAEVTRVLAPGGRFALFDIMMAGDGDIGFPAPWASDAGHSFVTPPDAYREAAAAAGLDLIAQRDRGAYAADFFRKVVAMVEAGKAPPVGLPLIMGEEAGTRYRNAVAAALSGTTAPWEMVFAKP